MNKFLILAILTVQTTAHLLFVRYTRSKEGELYLGSSVVTICELWKLTVSFVIILYNCEFNLVMCLVQIKKECFSSAMDFLRMMVPGCLYALQNNLLYVGLENLPAATYQVLNQVKTLTTALFSVLMLGKKLNCYQWLALLVLFVGVSLVQSSGAKEAHFASKTQNALLGVTTVIICSVSSGFACVWFEKVIKASGKQKCIWFANIQLATIGTALGLLVAFHKDFEPIYRNGFFQGYTGHVWVVIALQSAGGLIVSLVVKYADNILKGFACSAAIILSCFASYFLFDFTINAIFISGTSFVIAAILLYSKQSMPIESKTEEKSAEVREASTESGVEKLKEENEEEKE